MRGWAVAGWVALGLLLVSGIASAHPAGTTVTAGDGSSPGVTAQTFDEAFCLPTCQSDARQFGNTPPVIIAESGTILTWRSADFVYHTATSDIQTGAVGDSLRVAFGDDADGEKCLDLNLNPGSPQDATFEIRDDGLHVIQPSDTGDLEDNFCDEAGALPDGSYLFKLHCDAHPTYQHQVVQIVPEG